MLLIFLFCPYLSPTLYADTDIISQVIIVLVELQRDAQIYTKVFHLF